MNSSVFSELPFEKDGVPGWISLLKHDIVMCSFFFLTSMEPIHTPNNCSLLHLHSNDRNSLKRLILEKKNSIKFFFFKSRVTIVTVMLWTCMWHQAKFSLYICINIYVHIYIYI